MHGVQPQPRHPKKQVDPMKEKVNVAGHSARMIQRHIQATASTSDTSVQVYSRRNFFQNLYTFEIHFNYSLLLVSFERYLH